jgi:hypothetical protein
MVFPQPRAFPLMETVLARDTQPALRFASLDLIHWNQAK